MRTALLLVAFSTAAWCQNAQPTLQNARFEARVFSGTLDQQLRAASPTWFGYAIKAISKDRQSCCWNGQSQCGCWLEEDHSNRTTIHGHSDSPIALEGSDELAVLFRVVNNTVEKVQVYSLSCPLDAGGLPFVWLTAVPQDASLSFLRRITTENTSGRRLDGALFAISQHSGPQAVDALIQMARQSTFSHVRSQALFWLAQRAGDRAASTITDAILNDPDTDVKKKAVFALSQLPKDEAVPKLINIARTQRNPEVRKQAFFWLGQSQDDRALAFIQEVLMK